MKSLKEHLLAEIDAFQGRHGLSDTYLARLAINQSRAIIGLRSGRSTISIDTADRLLDFMRGYRGRKRGAAHFVGGSNAGGNGAVHGTSLNSSERRIGTEVLAASKTSQATEAA